MRIMRRRICRQRTAPLPEAGNIPASVRLTVLASLLLMAGLAQADASMPALLQFAEQYQGQAETPPASSSAATGAPGQTQKHTRPQQKPPATSPVAGERNSKNTHSAPIRTGSTNSTSLRRTLRQQELQLGQQRVTLREQAAELATLRAALKEAQVPNANIKVGTAGESGNEAKQAAPLPTDFTALHRLVGGLRQAVTGTPDDNRSAALIAEVRRQALAATQQQDKAEDALTQQKATLTQKDSQLTTLNGEKQALQTQYEALQQKNRQTETQLAALTRDKQEREGDISDLRAHAKGLANPVTLAQPAGRQAYAAGTALGKDIVGLLEERQGLGITVDRQTILAGVIDAFSGQYQLTTDVLSKALGESEEAILKAQESAAAGQQKTDDSYIARFSRQKGAKQTPTGFWYKVEYAGDAPIVGDAIVDVVVKESLTDGTVIQDMDFAGNVLSQPLSAYPPLFKEAIGLLKNHGSMTLVVPPALAYGETGYPPKVPPNATMVYVLRIEDSKVAGEANATTPHKTTAATPAR